MSLPATLAAQNGPTPSQSPAQIPQETDDEVGWNFAPSVTNDYISTPPAAK
jgi:hypothetical protein